MSRAKVQDKSTDVSLFPFLAVLLCTMGSLLVVLVAVTRMSRDKAAEEVAAQRAAAAASAAAAPDQSAAAADKRQEVQQYNAYLEQIRADANKKLHDDQLRLSHIEDHVRRLQDQLESLQYAAAELGALKEQHTHDREKSEQELARLQKLIAETRQKIDELKTEEASKPHSYAVVPYEGTSGTDRRPIYIECRRDKVVLQPEGIELTPNDFLPPLGPGNPLASALRAAREYIARESPVADTGKDTLPYPLILVRPDGIPAYYRVRRAIESWDTEFGYELVDGNWDLEFPLPNPQLAEAEHRAVELARARERMLAAAAPRAFGAARSGGVSSFDLDVPYDDDEDSDGGYGTYGGGNGGYGEYGSGNGGSTAAGSLPGASEAGATGGDTIAMGSAVADGDFGQDGELSGYGGEGEGSLAGPGGPELKGPGAGSAGSEPGSEGEQGPGSEKLPGSTGSLVQGGGKNGGSSAETGGGSPGAPGSQQSAGAMAAAGTSPDRSGSMSAGGTGTSSSMASSGSSSGASFTPPPNSASNSTSNPEGTPDTISFEQTFNQPTEKAAGPRGKDWALRGAKHDAVPIRRSIQVVVRQDRIAILPERSADGEPIIGGKEVRLAGATAAALDEFVTALQDTMRDWGMAGQGLYWRPVLVLNVGPDGEQRADDLTRMLQNSGLELRRASATAQHHEGPSASATR